MGTMYNIYAGYYEYFITDKKLKKPYVLTYSTEKKEDILQKLDELDDWILVDDSLTDWIDNYNAVFIVRKGLPFVIDEITLSES